MERAFPNQAEWTEWDLNPRLPPCEGGDHPLIYRPAGPPDSRHLVGTDGAGSCPAVSSRPPPTPRQEFLLRPPRTSRRCLDCHLDAPTTKNEERRAFIQDCTFTS